MANVYANDQPTAADSSGAPETWTRAWTLPNDSVAAGDSPPTTGQLWPRNGG